MRSQASFETVPTTDLNGVVGGFPGCSDDDLACQARAVAAWREKQVDDFIANPRQCGPNDFACQALAVAAKRRQQP